MQFVPLGNSYVMRDHRRVRTVMDPVPHIQHLAVIRGCPCSTEGVHKTLENCVDINGISEQVNRMLFKNQFSV